MGLRGGMRGLVNTPDEKPKITMALLKRVLGNEFFRQKIVEICPFNHG